MSWLVCKMKSSQSLQEYDINMTPTPTQWRACHSPSILLACVCWHQRKHEPCLLPACCKQLLTTSTIQQLYNVIQKKTKHNITRKKKNELAVTLRWFTAGGAIRIAIQQLSQTWKLRHYDVITRKLPWVKKKGCHPIHGYNFVNSWSIYKILSLLQRAVNFQQNPY